jgi:hypothetical protein
MKTNTSTNTNDIQFCEILKATNKELIIMYIKGTNKFAAREMRARGLY